jgi:hypothetical protein
VILKTVPKTVPLKTKTNKGNQGLKLFDFKFKRANIFWKAQKHKLKGSEPSGRNNY